MQINGGVNSRIYTPGLTAPQQPAAPVGVSAQDREEEKKSSVSPSVVVNISRAGRVFYALSLRNGDFGLQFGRKSQEIENLSNMEVAAVNKPTECQTCKERKYVDRSDDPSVSFQTPTNLSPGEAPAAVAAHEGEHVSHEQDKAKRENREVISQSVSIHTSICPECGRVYVSGGETRTTTAAENNSGQTDESNPNDD